VSEWVSEWTAVVVVLVLLCSMYRSRSPGHFGAPVPYPAPLLDRARGGNECEYECGAEPEWASELQVRMKTNKVRLSLLHSFTPSLILHHHFTASLLHCLTASLHHCITHSLLHSFTALLLHGITHSLHHCITHSLHHSFTHSRIHWPASLHSFTHSLLHYFTASLNHWITESLNHWITESLCYSGHLPLLCSVTV
jgi:hypothetical protein